MPKKEYFCMDCDCHFTVSMPRGYEVQFCPSCGADICAADCNDYEDDE